MSKDIFCLVSRLARMNPREIVSRFSSSLYDRYREIRLVLRGPCRISAVELLRAVCQEKTDRIKPELVDYTEAENRIAELFRIGFLSRKKPRFFFSPLEQAQLKEQIRSCCPGTEAAAIDCADRFAGRDFNFLGKGESYRERKINWHANWGGKKEWPRVFWKKINFLGPGRIGDIKPIWELNRHQYLLTLGKAYWYTNDERYAVEFMQQVDSWIEDNPFEVGINWGNSMEVGLRSIAWTWAYYFFASSPKVDRAFVHRFFSTLLLHARYLTKHLSRYTSPNTHLTGEALGLFYLGLLFPEFKESKKWKDTGFAILCQEIERQVFADGGYFEQSISYHRYTVDFYLQFVILCRENDIAVPARVLNVLEKMLEFMMSLTKPDGTVPMLGDADGGRALMSGGLRPDDYRDSLTAGAVLFNRPDMKQVAGKFNEFAFWLLGKNGWKEYEKLPETGFKNESMSLPGSGYCLMRGIQKNSDNYLLFDCGQQGAGTCGHGHADALSIEVYAFGKTQLPDTGTYTYNGPDEWRNYFRGTSAHNTVTVDESNQSMITGTFKWESIARSFLHRWIAEEDFDFAEGSHDGYRRLADPVIHRRKIFFVKSQYWIINDLLLGEGRHVFDRYFHLNTQSLVQGKTRGTVITKDGETGNIIILCPDAGNVQMETFTGATNPIRGWISPDYGNKRAINTVRYRSAGDAPAILTTLLLPFAGELPPEIEAENVAVTAGEVALYPREATCLRIRIGEVTDYLCLSHGGEREMNFDVFAFCGELVYLREAEGRIKTIFCINGFHLRRKEQVLLGSTGVGFTGVLRVTD